MYLLINLEGVWEVKFELLNENVQVPPPPPPFCYFISAHLVFQYNLPEKRTFL